MTPRPRPLRPREKITLLPSGEETETLVCGRLSFTVCGHVTALLLTDEYDPETNPSGTWQRTPPTNTGE